MEKQFSFKGQVVEDGEGRVVRDESGTQKRESLLKDEWREREDVRDEITEVFVKTIIV